MKNFINYLIISFLIVFTSHANEPLFVSLGSVCEVSHALRASGLRKSAYPFDWITTIDSEKFLEILDRNFEGFLDKGNLNLGSLPPNPLLNTYYRVEFLHDGDFRGNLYTQTMDVFQAKYQRRIKRFQNLNHYVGKVYFIRTAYQYSLTDHHRYYFSEDNLFITDEYAERLYAILLNLFPDLDFYLIVINHDQNNNLYEEKRLTERIIKIRSNPWQEPEVKWKACGDYLKQLV